MRESKVNSVFYAKKYHPIQAGSIDGTDSLPHDNAIYRAFLCSSAGLYDPFGDPKVIGDPFCTLFVGRLSHSTNENTLLKAMSKYGKVKNLRLVRNIVTGASRGYAFVEFETQREMRRAYMDAHHTFIDDSEIIVDYNRQQLMSGWIPRRLGGGLGGRKESGQLRFGGRERPFRAPLQSVPFDELKRLGISPPPEGRYMTRFQVPSPPRRNRSSIDREEESSHRRSSIDKERSHRSSSVEREERYRKRSSRSKEDRSHRSSSVEREERYRKRSSRSKEDRSHRSSSVERENPYSKRSSRGKEELSVRRHSEEEEGHHCKGSSVDRSRQSHENLLERADHHHARSSLDREKHYEERNPGKRQEIQQKFSDEEYSHRSSRDRKEGSRKRHKHDSRSERHKRRRATSQDPSSDW